MKSYVHIETIAGSSVDCFICRMGMCYLSIYGKLFRNCLSTWF